MEWRLKPKEERTRAVLLVSKFDHCLGDLLYRCRIGELPMEPVAIISNHPREALSISLPAAVPFHHFPITKDTKPEQEALIRSVIEETGAELVVLARYMQILSDEMSSFLPIAPRIWSARAAISNGAFWPRRSGCIARSGWFSMDRKPLFSEANLRPFNPLQSRIRARNLTSRSWL
jgi:hypothetical protein